ncbi:endonuclease domain-containing protein [Oleomonas cavernae]|uniref:Endonuclease domain-containing protein n=2 Tax=Oleomonas cavernae TaxID=2320859 RepID=A0A418WF70_9PROT|nr:endonuclease domain-containing protein [Oleomonas cavernae]
MTVSPQTLVARRLRRDATEAEKRLWRALLEANLIWKFRRQHPIGPYFVDFACPKRRLVIELDGGQHALSVAADASRTAVIARHGYRVIRFWNNEVMTNLTGVIEEIRRHLEAA